MIYNLTILIDGEQLVTLTLYSGLDNVINTTCLEVEILKTIMISIFIIFLTITSGVSFATDENISLVNTTEEEEVRNESRSFSEDEILNNIKNESSRIGEVVKTPTGGSKNISFDDGYNGYCINKGWNGADEDDSFKVKNTSMAVNSINKENVGNYLKILFVDYHDFAINNADETAKIIWNFTDREYWNSENEIIQGILRIAESGRVINDHGEVKRINDTTEALFNFEVLDSTKAWHQNFFGYKITYRNIPQIEEEPLLGQSPNETTTNNVKNTTSNSTPSNTTQKNNTTSLNTTQMNNTASNTTPLNTRQSDNNTDVKNEVNSSESADNKKNEMSNVNLSKHTTGYSTLIALIAILAIGIIIFKNRRD